MSEQPFRPPQEGDEPSFFTRLSIALCPQDDGTRPVNPAWAFSGIGFLSPAISYSTFPLKVGEKVTIKVHIDNFGTIDAVGSYLELAYNLYIGLQSQGLKPIKNVPLPIIPACGKHIAEACWIPPNTSAIHACVHARVFDNYSLLHYTKRSFDWSPYVNPQTACRNTILIKIEDETKPLVVVFPARNFLKSPIKATMLVTSIDSRERFANLEESYPLPYRLERVREAVSENVQPLPRLFSDRSVTTRTIPLIDRNGSMLLPTTPSGLWPRDEVEPRLVHTRFGFDIKNSVRHPSIFRNEKRFHFSTDMREIELKTFHTISLNSQEEKIVNVVIPPSEFPDHGRRKKFQVDYQIGHDHPTQQLIYIAY
jgi:hypothetical protein